MATLCGQICSSTVHGSDFWSVSTMRVLDDGNPKDIAVTGKLLGASAGDTVQLEGEFVQTKVHGRQFKFKSCKVTEPDSDEGTVMWLKSKLPNVGESRARQMLRFFGRQQLWWTIENDPSKLTDVPGITEERALQIVQAYAASRSSRDEMIQYRNWGMSDNQISKMKAEWGDKSEAKLKQNPYALIGCIHGFGFLTADFVARKMGVPTDSQGRIEAALVYKMKEAQCDGHCFVPFRKLASTVAENLLHISRARVVRFLNAMLKEGKTLCPDDAAQPRVYLGDTFKAEGTVAEWINR